MLVAVRCVWRALHASHARRPRRVLLSGSGVTCALRLWWELNVTHQSRVPFLFPKQFKPHSLQGPKHFLQGQTDRWTGYSTKTILFLQWTKSWNFEPTSKPPFLPPSPLEWIWCWMRTRLISWCLWKNIVFCMFLCPANYLFMYSSNLKSSALRERVRAYVCVCVCEKKERGREKERKKERKPCLFCTDVANRKIHV